MLPYYEGGWLHYGFFDLLEETLKRTNLGDLEVGDRVNLERSLGGKW